MEKKMEYSLWLRVSDVGNGKQKLDYSPIGTHVREIIIDCSSDIGIALMGFSESRIPL